MAPYNDTVKGYATWYERVFEQPLEPIFPFDVGMDYDSSQGGLPSVFVGREKFENGNFANYLKERMARCPVERDKNSCSVIEVFQCITGNLQSPQESQNVSISPGFRNSMVHFIASNPSLERAAEFYKLGNNSYFSESAFIMSGWEERYWGSANALRLHDIKSKYDPDSVFGCYHCIGYQEPI